MPLIEYEQSRQHILKKYGSLTLNLSSCGWNCWSLRDAMHIFIALWALIIQLSMTDYFLMSFRMLYNAKVISMIEVAKCEWKIGNVPRLFSIVRSRRASVSLISSARASVCLQYQRGDFVFTSAYITFSHEKANMIIFRTYGSTISEVDAGQIYLAKHPISTHTQWLSDKCANLVAMIIDFLTAIPAMTAVMTACIRRPNLMNFLFGL